MGAVAPALAGVRVMGLDGAIVLATLVVVGIAAASGRGPETRRHAAFGRRQGLARTIVPARRMALPDWAALSLPKPLLATLVLGVGLVVAGQRSLAGSSLTVPGLVTWLAGLAGLVALDRRLFPAPPETDVAGAEGDERAVDRNGTRTAVRSALMVGAGLAAAFVWTEMRARPSGGGRGLIFAAWVVSMAVLILAAGWPWARPLARRPSVAWSRVRANRVGIAIPAAIALAALVPRAVALSSYPWTFTGDDGQFAMTSISVLDGRLRDPFSTAFQSHPTLFFHLEAGMMRIFGTTVAGSRSLAVVLGTLAVLTTYLAARPHLGRLTAAVAAALLAGFHIHIYWSRSAMNNVADSLAVVLAIWLLDRGVLGRRRLDAALAGVTIGVAQHFYVGARILPALAAAYLLYALAREAPRSIPALLEAARRTAGVGAWVAAGAALAFLPLLAYAADHRAEFSGRWDQVSVFHPGWFAQRRELTGDGPAAILWDQFWDIVLLPFHTFAQGQYRGDPPFVGWPYAVPAAIGLAIATVGLRERRYLGWAVSYWVVAAGVTLTIGPPQTNRLVMTTPLLCVLAAIGLVSVARLACRALRGGPVAIAAVALVATAGITGWSLHLYFHDPTQPERYSDTNTEVANRMAYEARALGPDLVVYFSGSPRMWYGGFLNIPIIAPDAVGIDVDEPWGATSPRPAIAGPTLFVLLPERLTELEQVRAWFPAGTVTEYATERGEPLFTAYRVDA